MKDFIELLVKDFGLPEILASWIMLGVYLFLGLKLIVYLIKKALSKYRDYRTKKIINKDLHPYFTFEEIFKYTRYYIPQYFQNISPSESDEFNKVHAAAARSKLMPEFLQKGLLNDSSIKYFIILSDTGMGKTAFLINLYIRYKSLKPSLNKIKYKIELIPLGAKNALESISKIEDKKNTILLLDAFDEDIKAIDDYKSRMVEILDGVQEFRKVIFTCRTQFFPSKEEEPRDTNDISFGENKKHKIHKLYLSAFDNRDILKYLFKKYNLKIYKLFLSYSLVRKSPSLMFRPMLLSYIDDLIKEKRFYTYTFEMYYVLIGNWVNREAQKPAINYLTGNDNYSKKLLTFSKKLSIDLYTNREERKGYFITVEELDKLNKSKDINSDALTIGDKTGRSLLNRDSLGNYKFAHKSILEYFLATELFENPSFLDSFEFLGMDAAEKFHKEMIVKYINERKGKFYLKNDDKPKNLSLFSPRLYEQTERLIFSNCDEIEFKHLAGLKKLNSIIFTDRTYSIVYMIYLFVCFERRLLNVINAPGIKETFYTNVGRYSDEIIRLGRLRPEISINELKILVENCDIDDTLRGLFNKLLVDFVELNPLTVHELLDLNELKKYFNNGISENIHLSNSIKSIHRIQELEKYLPNVNLYY